MSWQTGAKPVTYSPETELLLREHGGIDNLMLVWKTVQDEIDAVKKKEMALRKAIFEVRFPNPKEGTQRAELGNGYNLKAVAKFNYTLDKDPNKVERALDRIEKLGNEGSFIAERLVKWKADISVSEYRKLAAEDATENQRKIKRIIDEVLTVSPGAPVLEIEEPKAK